MDYTAPVQKNAGIVMTKSQLANYFVKTLPLLFRDGALTAEFLR